MIARADVPALVVAVIAETFDADPADIDRSTVADDVSGWDSLAHTVLMIRLEKRLGIRIGERVAMTAASVGELIDRLMEAVPE